jgi:ABC-type polysaccharide/polyol phosphate transport system ATPase subunit
MKTVIHFSNVSKKFKLSLSRPRSFQEALVRRRLRAEAAEFWALKNVSFDVRQGESVGLIGANGAGKSTILKLISRIIEPSSGEVARRGRVAGLLELGAGFHPDLTGRENIYLNASILGIPRPAVHRQIDGIVDFAGVGAFIDVPVRNYSSGMAMRLGFAITTALEPDILLIDEILAVGDHAFQRRCLGRLDALRARGVTMVFVSHNLDQVQRLCPRVIWMADGELRADGDTETLIGRYLDAASPAEARRFTPRVQTAGDGASRWGTYQAEITAVELLGSQDRPQQVFLTGSPFRVRIHYRTQAPVAEPTFGLALYRSDGLHINGPNSALSGHPIDRIDGNGYVEYHIPQLPLAPGQYELTIAIYDRDSTLAYDHHHRMYAFEVQDRRLVREEGIVHIPADWRHVPNGQPTP